MPGRALRGCEGASGTPSGNCKTPRLVLGCSAQDRSRDLRVSVASFSEGALVMRTYCGVGLWFLFASCACPGEVQRIREAVDQVAQRVDRVREVVVDREGRESVVQASIEMLGRDLAQAVNNLHDVRRSVDDLAAQAGRSPETRSVPDAVVQLQAHVTRNAGETARLRRDFENIRDLVVRTPRVVDGIKAGFDSLRRALRDGLDVMRKASTMPAGSQVDASPKPNPNTNEASAAVAAGNCDWLRYAVALVAMICGVIVIGIAAGLIRSLGPSTNLEDKKLHFAAATFTGILLFLLMAELFQFVAPTPSGKEIFDKAITAMSPIAGAIVGYFFASRGVENARSGNAAGTGNQEPSVPT